MLGAKSQGRGSNFLLRTGFEQVRDAFALLLGKPGWICTRGGDGRRGDAHAGGAASLRVSVWPDHPDLCYTGEGSRLSFSEESAWPKP